MDVLELDPSCGLMKKDDSIGHLLASIDGRSPVSLRKKSPSPSHVSLKSDTSMKPPMVFKDDHSLLQRKKDESPRCESMKSDGSMKPPMVFKDAHAEVQRMKNASPSCESMKSNGSMKPPIIFKDSHPVLLREKNTHPSCDSVKSDGSMKPPIVFKDGDFADLREPDPNEMQLSSIFALLEENILTFIKEELRRFYRLLVSEDLETSVRSSESDDEQSSREAALNITLDFLRRMKHEDLATSLSIKNSVGACRKELQQYQQQKFGQLFEGVAKAGNPVPLHQIYTDLYVTEGGTSEVNQEHEIRHIEVMSRRPTETTVKCEDIFKSRQMTKVELRAEGITGTEVMEEKLIRTVLTKGVAGVGKTVLTQKFSLDWAEGKANQEIHLLFPFTFRELNVLKDTAYSLMELVHHFFSQTKRLCGFHLLKVLFIFDGLDECRLPLNFSQTRVLTEPTESASVEELLVNLIRGSLLPSARLWITTRPAAANQIPAECISMVTEVRGFTNLQKEQYFTKRFRNQQQSTAVISHIKNIHSLYIMCHIPIFCWILSTVLLHQMTKEEELPHTLTQMYIHFLVVQAKVTNIKYHKGSGADPHWTPETKEMLYSLGKLAFEQLMKGNLIFYERDLRECGLDAAAASVYSGVFTQVFREEQGLYQTTVYCFIHLTVQEFLAAFHVHQTFFTTGENLLSAQKKSKSETAFYRAAVNLALQSQNGHLDLFLRFLLGFSVSTNQNLLKGVLSQSRRSTWTNQETIKYIKTKLNEGLPAEKSLNLLHCLSELNDRSLLEEIKTDVKEGGLCDKDMSPGEWSAFSFLMLSSDSDLKEFDLRTYCSSERALLGLLPVVKASPKAILSGCGLSSVSCGSLASVLRSSSLTNLDLSNNDLQDSGVELLCSGLKSAPCRLQTLKLSGCLVTETGGAVLVTTLNSTSFALRDLDLSYNHPGASADQLTALQAPHGPLHSLRLEPSGEQWMVSGLRKYACEFSLDPNTAQRFLRLSENKRRVEHVTTDQRYPEHQDRFSDWHRQALSVSGLRGRCYWEVDWCGEVDIAVSYRGIKRRGQRHECVFGDNDQSWRLRIFDGHYSVCHNRSETPISSSLSRSGRVAVFLDSEAGALSFYSVLSDGELFHLHSFSSSFTEPVFPGFGLWSDGDSVSVVDLRRAPPGGPV